MGIDIKAELNKEFAASSRVNERLSLLFCVSPFTLVDTDEGTVDVCPWCGAHDQEIIHYGSDPRSGSPCSMGTERGRVDPGDFDDSGAGDHEHWEVQCCKGVVIPLWRNEFTEHLLSMDDTGTFRGREFLLSMGFALLETLTSLGIRIPGEMRYRESPAGAEPDEFLRGLLNASGDYQWAAMGILWAVHYGLEAWDALDKEPETEVTHVTFGFKYKDMDHPRLGKIDRDRTLTIHGVSYGTAVSIAGAITGGAYAFSYGKDERTPSEALHPDGPFMEIVVTRK